MSDGRRALEAVRAFPGALAVVGRDGRILLTSRAWAAADSTAWRALGGTAGPGDSLPARLREGAPAGGSEIADRLTALLEAEGGATEVQGMVAAAGGDGGASRIHLEAHPLEIAGERAALVLMMPEVRETGPVPKPPASAPVGSHPQAAPPAPEPEAAETDVQPPRHLAPRHLAEALGDVEFEAAPDGSAVRYVSPGWEELWGTPREVLYRRPAALLDGVHPHDRERIARALRRMDESPLNARFRVVRPDGRTHWVWARSRPWSSEDEWVSGTFADVTAQVRRETALAEALEESRRHHARHRAVFESSGVGIALLDHAGEVVEANRALADLLGWEGTSPPGDAGSLWAFIGGDHRRMAEECRAVAAGEGEGWIGEIRLDRDEGEPLDLRVHLAPAGTQDRLCVLLVENVSDRRSLDERLAQAQRIESLGRLAGGIAHDFNNLITVIRGHAELLLLDHVSDAADRQALEEIRVAGDRAARLTGQLLSFSRRTLLRPQLVDLNDVVTGIEELLRHTLGESAQLRLTREPDLPPVLVDPPQLEQALLNLVTNARDALEGHGEVEIRTFAVELDHDFVRAHPGSTMGPHVAVAVRDTGRGMDEGVRARVFEPFFTTKPPGEGSGLGLPMAYGLVKQSGGYIEASSGVGKGSTFTIYLPATEGPAEARGQVRETGVRYRSGDAAAGEAATVSGRRTGDTAAGEAATVARRRTRDAAAGDVATILVVEDEPMVQLIARKVLENRGYRVLTAGSGQEALAVSRGREGPIDLLLSDVVLPGMGGGELWQRFEKERPETKVLFMSGYADDAVVQHGVGGGEAPFIAKPFTLDELAARVEQVLEES